MLQRAARIAAERGRRVHVVRWDVARLAFERPEILARYPEVGGVTHPTIRRAVGVWVRPAVQRWHEAADEGGLLLGETPLVGERLAELARRRDDGVEPLLASERTVFIVPVPSGEVRRAVTSARERDMAAPQHVRDAASAPPHLVRWHWDDLLREAGERGVSGAVPGAGYDARLYAAAYRTLLRDRHDAILPMDAVLDVRGSVHDVASAGELVPAPEEVAAALAAAEAGTPAPGVSAG